MPNAQPYAARPPAEDAIQPLMPAVAGREVLRPGQNCWRADAAGRAAVMIDAAAYFTHLAEALQGARRSILIVGWDFDGEIRLRPDRADAESLPLGELLRGLVEAHPELEVRILVWSAALVYGPGASWPLLRGAAWREHPRIHLRLDREHPIYAAHHQKLVVIDDAVAFVGGIDLTVRRWDTCGHDAADARRVSYDGSTYGPVHDMQMAVDGAPARSLGEVARDRWRMATGETLAPPPPAEGDRWPAGLEPDFEDEAIAIARTYPGWKGNPAVREAAALTRDMLRSARRHIYIEAQYLTAGYVCRILEASLARSDGPEVLIVLTLSVDNLLEHLAMAGNGDRLIRRLRRADRFGRLRVCYPVVPGADGKECAVGVHSKLVVVDDTLLRIGSSNLNNRSIGLDTECDAAIEAATPETRRAIARLRDCLIAEHLGVAPAAFAAAMAETGSMLAAFDRLNGGP
ncbi:MAG TPA: phospholipase D-like domain-containing protein, partial [Alphaproteobacteria bacterium]|nr:phospholipase D-like domain-containing protein [Alphaproteobacteria bacterium]